MSYNSDNRGSKDVQVPVVTGALAPSQTVEESVEHAKRAFALKKYEQAVDHYATALELAYVASIFCNFSRSTETRLLLSAGRKNTGRMHRKLLIYIFRMERHC